MDVFGKQNPGFPRFPILAQNLVLCSLTVDLRSRCSPWQSREVTGRGILHCPLGLEWQQPPGFWGRMCQPGAVPHTDEFDPDSDQYQ